MDALGWVIVAVVVAAVAVILWMAGRRAWNADGSDDDLRRRRHQR
jgi:hypothetical protein